MNQGSPVSDVSQLLERLHSRNEMPVGYLALYKSNAIHNEHVSRENPRILIKWRNSVLSFNQESKSLEVISFDEESKKFEMYHYTLSLRLGSRHKAEKNHDFV